MDKSNEIADRKQKILDLKKSGHNLYPNDIEVLHTVKEVMEKIDQLAEDLTEDASVFALAGRMMAINKFGKSSFVRFRDRTGQMQAYIRVDQVGEDSYALFKQLDIGDFVGLKGTMFKTRTG